MKRLTVILLAAVLCLGLTGVAMAIKDTQDVLCTINLVEDAITAPVGDVLVTTRGGVVDSVVPGILTYSTGANGYNITVSATGDGVENAKLLIKGGDLGDYTPLITGANPGETAILDVTVEPGIGEMIEDIVFRLDASGVLAEASGLGTPWTYTVTYTMGA